MVRAPDPDVTRRDLAELGAEASAIQIQGARLPERVLVLSELEAPPPAK